MKKSLVTVLIALLISSTAAAAPLTNYSFPHFEVDAKVKGLGQVTPSSAIQNLFNNSKYDFCYDFGATLGLAGGFAVNAQVTTDRLGNPGLLPVNYNSFEANLMYNVLETPFLPNVNVFAGYVLNFNGQLTPEIIGQQVKNLAAGNNNGWQVGAQASYGLPLLGSIYASGAYGNTRITWEAGLAIPVGLVFDIDAGYKFTQYGGTTFSSDANKESVAFQGPFLGATLRI